MQFALKRDVPDDDTTRSSVELRDMIPIIIMLAIGLGQWLIYTALLWIMIKLQKLNYNVVGLFASSLAATALGHIPIVGQYIGWAVLVICLWKCTGADIAPDVLFTVGVAGALMFCVNLFAIGALMTGLGLGALAMASNDHDGNDADNDGDGDEVEQADGSTNVIKVAGTPWQKPDVSAVKTKPVSPKTSIVSSGGNTTTATTAEGRALAAQLTLKGVGMNAAGKSAMIMEGKQIHTVGLGETMSISAGSGTVTFVCEEITQSSVILALERGEKIKVGFR